MKWAKAPKSAAVSSDSVFDTRMLHLNNICRWFVRISTDFCFRFFQDLFCEVSEIEQNVFKLLIFCQSCVDRRSYKFTYVDIALVSGIIFNLRPKCIPLISPILLVPPPLTTREKNLAFVDDYAISEMISLALVEKILCFRIAGDLFRSSKYKLYAIVFTDFSTLRKSNIDQYVFSINDDVVPSIVTLLIPRSSNSF